MSPAEIVDIIFPQKLTGKMRIAAKARVKEAITATNKMLWRTERRILEDDEKVSVAVNAIKQDIEHDKTQESLPACFRSRQA